MTASPRGGVAAVLVPDPEGLAAAARALGVPCTVTVEGRLAVLAPADPAAPLPVADVRRLLVGAARAAGFTHAAFVIGGVDEGGP